MHSGKALNYLDLLNEPFTLPNSNPVGRCSGAVNKGGNVATGRNPEENAAASVGDCSHIPGFSLISEAL